MHFFTPQILPSQRYICARDLVFFCLEFFAGYRGSDLKEFLLKKCWLSPTMKISFLDTLFGKTLRGKHSKTSMVKKCSNIAVCLVSNLVCSFKFVISWRSILETDIYSELSTRAKLQEIRSYWFCGCQSSGPTP